MGIEQMGDNTATPNSLLKVLIIEDNPGDADLLIYVLKRAEILNLLNFSFDCVVQDSLQKAEDYLDSQAVNLLISDLNLPDSNGEDTIERLNKRMLIQPSIMLTGVDSWDMSVKSLQNGFQDYLVKSDITPNTLAKSIRYAMDRFKLLETINSLAIIDDLTKLYNHRAFYQIAENQLQSLARDRKDAVLLYIDIDDFKSINNTFGHLEGDFALGEAAKILKSTLLQSDIIGRVGGDEFVVLSRETTNVSHLIKKIEDARKESEKNFNKPYRIIFNVGYCIREYYDVRALSELIDAANQCMLLDNRDKKLL